MMVMSSPEGMGEEAEAAGTLYIRECLFYAEPSE